MATNTRFYRRGFHTYGVVNLCSVNLLMKAVVLEDVVLHLVQLGLSYISSCPTTWSKLFSIMWCSIKAAAVGERVEQAESA